MRPNMYRITFLCIFPGLLALAGCGGNSGGSGPQTVTFTLNTGGGGSVGAAAVQMGSDAFTSATLNGNKLTFTLPPGTSKYAVAWTCTTGEIPDTDHSEFVIYSTPSDTPSFTWNCNNSALVPQPPPVMPPTSWSYSGPTPAAFPTFAFDTYSGLNGQKISQEAFLGWTVKTQINPVVFDLDIYAIDVKVTPSYLNGQTAPVTIPNTGLFNPPNSGQTVVWDAEIIGTSGGVQTSGNYVEP